LRQAAHDTSSRNGVQEMQLISKAMPNPEMSQAGFGIVASQLKATNDFLIARAQAGAQWAQQHGGSMAGFQAAWNQNVSPAAFVFERMQQENPDVLRDTVTRMSQTPAGKAALKNIRAEWTWAQQNNLLGGP
jgi:hypothetical protein